MPDDVQANVIGPTIRPPIHAPRSTPTLSSLSDSLGWAALLILLGVGLPLFVCMPLYNDASFYDVAARNLLLGGVHYRDVFDHNLPGMVWLHVAIRYLYGWRSETLRVADFLCLSLTIGLIVLWMRSVGVTASGRLWAAVCLIAFYLTTPESCHCQRDVWMLLPAMGAVTLRSQQLRAMRTRCEALGRLALRATVEGLLWGIAIWIKPFVIVPALACFAVSTIIVARAKQRVLGIIMQDGAALLLGGILAAAPGMVWLWTSGSWPWFLDAVTWARDYYSEYPKNFIDRTMFLLQQVFPWGWVHVMAVPIALSAVWRTAIDHRTDQRDTPPGNDEALFSALYLGWLLQANFLQHGFLYHIAPATLLAGAVVAGRRWLPGQSLLGWVVLSGFLAMAAARHPLTDMKRTALWARCWKEGASPDLENRLALEPKAGRPDWVELERVAEFLKARGIRDKELTCYSFGTLPLLLALNVSPSTRFAYIDEVLFYYRRRQDTVRFALATSPERYIVSDAHHLMGELRLFNPNTADPTDPDLFLRKVPPYVRTQYPWSEPVVFQAGQYLVHQSTEALRRNEDSTHNKTGRPAAVRSTRVSPP